MKNKKLSIKRKINKRDIYLSIYIFLTVFLTLLVYFLTKNIGNALLVLAVSTLLYFMFITLVGNSLRTDKIIDLKREDANNFYSSLYENTIADVDFKNAFMKSVENIHDESKKAEMIEYIENDKIVDLPPKLYSSTKETLVRISLYNMARVKAVRKENLRKYKMSLDNFIKVKKEDDRIFYSFLYLGFSIYLFVYLMMIVKGM